MSTTLLAQAIFQLKFALEVEGIELTSIGVDNTQRLDDLVRRDDVANLRPEPASLGPRPKGDRIRTIYGVAVVCRKGES